MKKQILAILFITLAGLPMPQAAVRPFVVDLALEEAFGIISAVTRWTGSPELKSVGQKILKLRPLIRVHSPSPGREYTYCQDHPQKESLMAYVDRVKNHIYVCQATLERDWVGLPQLVQNLIHEMIHLAGVIGECETYRLEIAIIKAYGRKEAYESDYKITCQ